MSCGCNKKTTNEPQKTDCGCGCGPSCSCADCQAKWHGQGSKLGSFNEYPRPKAAMFDPRKIMSEWPEPNDDPLIPYVRANEQGLPYEMLNRYEGQPNSLHGWQAGTISLNGVNELNIVKNTTSNLLDILASQDQSMVELNNELADIGSENILYIPNAEAITGQRVQYRTARKASSLDLFFAFVPLIIRRGNVAYSELYIRMGGPEAKSNWLDIDAQNVKTLSGERDYLLNMDSYIAEYKGLSEVKTEAMRVLQDSYPILFGTGTTASSKQFRLMNNGGDYTTSENAYKMFAYMVMNHLVSQGMMKLSDNRVSNAKKDDIKDMLKLIMKACIDRSDVRDVANGLSNAFCDRLKSDYQTTEVRSYCELEIEVIGPNSRVQIDPKLRSVFDKNRANFSSAINTMRSSLATAFESVINESNSSFSKVLKDLLDYENINKANDRIKALESQLTESQQSSSDAESLKQEELQRQVQIIAQKEQQIASLNRQLNETKNDLTEKENEIKAIKNEQQASNASVMDKKESSSSDSGSNKTILIGGGLVVLAAGAWFLTKKK